MSPFRHECTLVIRYVALVKSVGSFLCRVVWMFLKMLWLIVSRMHPECTMVLSVGSLLMSMR